MDNKKKNNIYFFILIFLGFILISIFNYFIDSKKLFHPNNGLWTTEYIRDEEIPFFIDLYKNIKRDTLVIGFSEAGVLFNDSNISEYFINEITTTTNSFKSLYLCVKEYIKVHNETKKVVIIVPCNKFFGTSDNEKDVVKKINNNEIFLKLLLSKYNTEKNIDSIIQPIFNNIFSKNENIKTNYIYFIYPYAVLTKYYTAHKEIVEKDNIEKIEYLEKIINLLKNKNIEYKIIIPPYNAVHLSLIKEYGYEAVYENMKKVLVDKFGIIYDFSFVNRLTKTNTYADYNYWFYLPDHPSPHFGYKILTFLFFNESADDSIFVKLTKENVDEQLKKQKELLNRFIADNKNYVDFYEKNVTDINEYYKIYLTEDIPFELKKETNFLYKKLYEKNHKDFRDSTLYINSLKQQNDF